MSRDDSQDVHKYSKVNLEIDRHVVIRICLKYLIDYLIDYS